MILVNNNFFRRATLNAALKSNLPVERICSKIGNLHTAAVTRYTVKPVTEDLADVFGVLPEDEGAWAYCWRCE